MKRIFLFIASLALASCQSKIEEAPMVTTPEPQTKQTVSDLKIIGGVETLYVLPINMPFQARIDTGAETSSIDVQNMRPFERDGDKWVSFDIINRKNGEKHHFEKPVIRRTNIVRIEDKEHRYVVNMSIKMGDEIISTEFTLAEREKFTYQVLIGRNILNGRFIVDSSQQNTLH